LLLLREYRIIGFMWTRRAIIISCLISAAPGAYACEYCFLSEHGYVFDMNRTLIRVDSRLQSFSGLTGSYALTDEVTTKYVSTFFSVNYATGQWGFTASVPFVYRFQRNTFTGSPALHYQHLNRPVSTIDSASLESNSVRGFGDMTALVRYALFQESGETFASLFVQGGMKLATGSTDSRDAQGYLLHPHLQVGTGTTVALMGLMGSYGGFKESIDLSVLAGVPVRAPGVFREAASFNYDATFRLRLLPEDAEDGPMLIQELGVVGRVSGKERYKGVNIPDSGGHYIFLNVGWSFMPVPNFAIELSGQVPLTKDLTGNQLDEQFRLSSGIQLSL
jgi:hypothetical protein